MKKTSNVDATNEKIHNLPVLGFIISLVFFVIGYYIKEKSTQAGIQGDEAIFMSSNMLLGKLMYISSAIFFMISLISHFRELIHKNKDFFTEESKSLSNIEKLSWKEFMEYIMLLFKKLGYTLEGESGSRDEGFDLKVKRDGRLSLIRCKKYYVRKVPLSMLNEFYDAMSNEPGLHKGYFITTGFFSREAWRFASDKQIDLIDRFRLMDFVRTAESIDAAQEMSSIQDNLKRTIYTCPMCGAHMELRTVKNDSESSIQFWGCSTYPACKGTLRKGCEELGHSG
jgi:restriction system protein